jgi:hypothetical protein
VFEFLTLRPLVVTKERNHFSAASSRMWQPLENDPMRLHELPPPRDNSAPANKAHGPSSDEA